MKKSIIFLAAIFTLFSCIDDAYTPSSLTSQGQSMFSSWHRSMTDCIYSHAKPAQLLEEYQTLADEAQRQDFANRNFPNRVIIQDGAKWVVLYNLATLAPMIEVEYSADTAFVTTYYIGGYYPSDFDYSQSDKMNSKLVKNGENFDFELVQERETELNLKLDNRLNVADGNGFFYNNGNIKMEFEIIKPLFYSTANTIIDGEIDIKATNFDGKAEDVNLKFDGNSIAVTFRGVTERVSYNQLMNSGYYYGDYYY